jgi:hypothetical protein
MLTMAAVGQGSVCFSCGQPLPHDLTAGVAPQPAAPAFPLTGYVPELAPPPNPYGPTGATILGAAGQFAIRTGVEVRVGRDPSECAVTLAEPRISGIHATLKFEGGQLFVRDERSNNGTFVGEARVAAGAWTYAPAGSTLRFGPVEFVVRVN